MREGLRPTWMPQLFACRLLQLLGVMLGRTSRPAERCDLDAEMADYGHRRATVGDARFVSCGFRPVSLT